MCRGITKKRFRVSAIKYYGLERPRAKTRKSDRSKVLPLNTGVATEPFASVLRGLTGRLRGLSGFPSHSAHITLRLTAVICKLVERIQGFQC